MITVRVSLEQLKALLRRIAPKLTIQQRMKLLRELAREDLPMDAAPRREDPPAPKVEPPAWTPPPLVVPVVAAPPAAAPVERDEAFVWHETPAPSVAEPPVAPAPVSVTSPTPLASTPPTDDGKDDASGRIAWERRLYRLFKPARAQAKHLEGAQLSDLIRRSVVEVRSR